MKYVCELCGKVYDEELGDAKRGIPGGTAFADLPQDYECSGCGSEKEAFSQAKKQVRATAAKGNDREFWTNVKYSEGYHESER